MIATNWIDAAGRCLDQIEQGEALMALPSVTPQSREALEAMIVQARRRCWWALEDALRHVRDPRG